MQSIEERTRIICIAWFWQIRYILTALEISCWTPGRTGNSGARVLLLLLLLVLDSYVLHFIDSCFVKMQTEDVDCLLYDCMLQSELERKRFEEKASHHLMRQMNKMLRTYIPRVIEFWIYN